MMKNNFVIKTLGIALGLLTFLYAESQVTLSTDFTSESYKKAALHDIWKTANRISPETGAGVKTGMEVNLIRMIGGIMKTVDGVRVPYLEYDPVTYNETTGEYVYNWTPLITRLDHIVNSNTKIHQLVLDQVPWAFQHGYTFIPKGTTDNINFRADEQISSYGNSLPPFDKVAYHDFIKALIQKLVDTYGLAEVESWRFRVGSEIETPDHWFGTKQDFIDHFANTEKAVRAILPDAEVGVHTRDPGFNYKNGTVLNYKGEPFASFAKDLIEYCYDNDVRYDFWGISDYVLINGATQRDISVKYEKLFAPMITHPKWNTNATLDMMEYNVVITMAADDGRGYLNCATSHADLVNIGFSDMIYKNADKGMDGVFRWGQRPNSSDPESVEVLNTMEGKVHYQTNKSGSPKVSTTLLDAIFAKSEQGNQYDVLLYSFNASSLDYKAAESVNIAFNTEFPVGTVLNYRVLNYGEAQNKLQNFLKDEPVSGWVKSGWDKKGDPSRSLNEEGAALWATYNNPNPAVFSEWSLVTTVPLSGGGSGSMVTINTSIPSFAFQKFEFQQDPTVQFPFNGVIPIPGSFEAENYDTGGEGVAYNDSETGNLGGQYRTDGVDISATPDNGFCISHTMADEWVEYTINVQADGLCDLQVLYSSKLATGGILGAELPEKEVVLFNDFLLPQTSDTDWYVFKTDTLKNIALEKGQQIIRFNVVSRGFNLDKFTIENSQSTAVKEVLDNKLMIYPNPSSSGIFNLDKEQSWTVCSLSGATITSGNGQQVNLSHYPKGMYLLKVNNVFVKIIFK